MTINETSDPRYLACCVCDGSTYGRQWWNRDTGFGICDQCASDLVHHRGYSAEQMRDYYGIEGVHYNLGSEELANDESQTRESK